VAAGAPSAFAYVEAFGLRGAFEMLRASFPLSARRGDALRAGLDRPEAAAAPMLTQDLQGQALTATARTDLAERALRGMSLVGDFAPLVAFIGHGAAVSNNPQAAGLACGACGGQSGEVNARAMAELLNDPAVRAGLGSRGIQIPEATRFVGGVHDTVTDDVQLFPDAATVAAVGAVLETFRQALGDAGRRSRRERAPRLGLEPDDPMLDAAIRDRARDWSEVRPEWALARNAAFIAAPRSRSRGLNLDGRAFLHEYDWRVDQGFGVLEVILTAPVVVAHWINFQYYTSTVDPERFGSGDKTLHNVVGGTVGVYEGQGGDLRIGLARQSVHDGTDWVHEPLRLAVFIDAPTEAIDGVLAKHRVLQDLVGGEWLYLYALGGEGEPARRRRAGRWERVPANAGTAAR
jgi:uncharacterized protein YbcC (UPF0753/DUF2309 family)